MPNQEIMNRVTKRIAEVLALGPEEIEPHSRLIQDLGADSLDLVELMYLLEQEFELIMDADDLSLSSQLGLAEEELHQDEVLTPQALALLRPRFPEAATILVEGVTRKELASLLTVAEVAKAVESKLAQAA